MPAVYFYILNITHNDTYLVFLCRLIEKMYLKHHTLFIFYENQKEAENLDEALWTFRPSSFIPHHIQGEGPLPPPPVQIGLTSPALSFRDILINMKKDVPLFYTQFKTIIEIIDKDKEQARSRYRAYQSAGCKIITHQMNLKELTDDQYS